MHNSPKAPLTKQIAFFSLLFILQLLLTPVLVINPPAFFHLLGRLTPIANENYLVAGWESGYGVPEAIKFIRKESYSKNIIVLIRQDGGNPEDAIITAFFDNPRVLVIQIPKFDQRQSEEFIKKISQLPLPAYFVSRGRQYAGLNQYLTEITRFDKPWSQEFVGIYLKRRFK